MNHRTLGDLQSRAKRLHQWLYEHGSWAVPWSKADEHHRRLVSRAVAELDATSCPPTHNAPTGAGDYDIVCDGCGEVVPDPHSWAECCAAQRKRVEHLCGELAKASHRTEELEASLKQAWHERDRFQARIAEDPTKAMFVRLESDLEETKQERDVARKHGDELEDALVAIKEAIDAPHDVTALDAEKALHLAHAEAKLLIGLIVLAVATLKTARDSRNNEQVAKSKEALVTIALRVAHAAVSVPE